MPPPTSTNQAIQEMTSPALPRCDPGTKLSKKTNLHRFACNQKQMDTAFLPMKGDNVTRSHTPGNKTQHGKASVSAQVPRHFLMT